MMRKNMNLNINFTIMHLFYNENSAVPLQSQSLNSAEGKEALVILRTRKNK
jgi:hypothetical protein